MHDAVCAFSLGVSSVCMRRAGCSLRGETAAFDMNAMTSASDISGDNRSTTALTIDAADARRVSRSAEEAAAAGFVDEA